MSSSPWHPDAEFLARGQALFSRLAGRPVTPEEVEEWTLKLMEYVENLREWAASPPRGDQNSDCAAKRRKQDLADPGTESG